jgi:hypothetical protein
MDRERFDSLTRLFASRGSRRGALGALVGIALMGRSTDSSAEPGNGKGAGRGRGQGKGRDEAPGRLPDGGWDPDEGSTCIAAECPPDPRTGKRGRCCPSGWCSCGDVCCATSDCWIVTTEVRGGDTPQRVEREYCEPPADCRQCSQSGSACCTSCTSDGQCQSSGPISGGLIRSR